ncbi:hypothetical protein ACQKP0_25465 [Heyndrickxia sp. NPDC080065]|uniref:hypothetical protein n=1 Tax=Heyndrickxia sp. NPDC080065 TaxID=3390568 RepID=UPI003CFF6DF4
MSRWRGLYIMIEIGEKITNVGFSIIPYSFFAFLLIRFLEFMWRLKISKIIKSIWYLSIGLSMLFGDPRIDTIVMLVAFIEAFDLLFQFLEDKRSNKS